MADDAANVTPGLRRARPSDADQLRPLLNQLGYVMDIDRPESFGLSKSVRFVDVPHHADEGILLLFR